jgi:catechol-2,3-dioxygenase
VLVARINKVAHVVLNVKDIEASLKFYSEAMGMEVVTYRPERRMAFLGFGTQHHDIALFEVAKDAERGKLGLNHIAFQIDGGVEELTTLYQRLLKQHVPIDHLSDHGISKSVYFLDPDGNRLEIFCETLATVEEGKEYLRTNRAGANPLTLEGVPARS